MSMEQSDILRMNSMGLQSINLRKFSFEASKTRDEYALLARENNILASSFVVLGDKCALFTKEDCFGCLLPHMIAV